MSLDLPTPLSFPAFPYDPPYPIQVDLMRHLYASIEAKKVTIVESPTGTGKTLSLLCASLTWLADEKNRAKKGKLTALDSENAADWVVAQTRERHQRELEEDERAYEERLAAARKKEVLARKIRQGKVTKKIRIAVEPQEDSDDDSFLPQDDVPRDGDDNISPAVRALMQKLETGRDTAQADREQEPTCTKIYYASRTHSQLTQILPELRKLKLFPIQASSNALIEASPSLQPFNRKRHTNDDSDEDCAPIAYSRTVSLGSRKQLCINEELRAKKRDLDEGCRELLAEKGNRRCQNLPPPGDSRMDDFRDLILASPKDIEELASAGQSAHVCPYFGSRRAIPQAELVLLPYNLLLQKTAREALGIDLQDQIVIIDEAHNLISTLLSLSTTYFFLPTLTTSLSQISQYIAKFRTRLSATNLLHLRRLVVFLDALQKFVADWKGQYVQKMSATKVLTVADLLIQLGHKAVGVNLLEIVSYLKSSKVAWRIASYSDKVAEKSSLRQGSAKVHRSPGAIPPLQVIETFLLAISGKNEDGRVILTMTTVDEVEVKYQLLNPAPHFAEIVAEARSIVLAGGTMSPMSDFVNQLFAHVPKERLSNFSCGHIIPSSNLQTLIICKGPSGSELEYKAKRQNDKKTVIELGQILLNLASVVPGGMVVFFPSYNFLNYTKGVWHEDVLLKKLKMKKKVFFEPESSTEVEQVLREYATEVQAPPSITGRRKPGAILFAVIGAKLSEGLNFSDDLARAVVIVGLPFANLASPDLQERMKYVKRLESGSPINKQVGQKDAAAELYENMCMNAVNQSIGRAIRHRGDWASLILLDRRYSSSQIQKKLPKWIGESVILTQTFGQAMKNLGSFYRAKKE